MAALCGFRLIKQTSPAMQIACFHRGKITCDSLKSFFSAKIGPVCSRITHRCFSQRVARPNQAWRDVEDHLLYVCNRDNFFRLTTITAISQSVFWLFVGLAAAACTIDRGSLLRRGSSRSSDRWLLLLASTQTYKYSHKHTRTHTTRTRILQTVFNFYSNEFCS